MSSEPITVRAGVLDVACRCSGPADGEPAILLHGFPYDAHAYDEVAPRLASAGFRAIVPSLRGYGATRFRDPATMRSGQQGALAADLLALLDALGIRRATLAGYDWGGRAACIVAALHPERVRALVTVNGYNVQDIAASAAPKPPDAERRLWYQYYFHGERGRAGLAEHRDDLARLLWREWSPAWAFDAATFERTAPSFRNSDFVDVVIHSYRHRFGLVAGDPAYEPIERALAASPAIAVPTVVVEGEVDGVHPPLPEAEHAAHFAGPFAYRRLAGVGHAPPHEAPDAFAAAILAARDAAD